MQTYFLGNFTRCGGSEGNLGDQDPMTNIALQFPRQGGQPPPPTLGEFHEWPFCFNYRGWHSESGFSYSHSGQQHCRPRKDYFLLHQDSQSWKEFKYAPVDAKNMYAQMAREGKCRQSRRPASNFKVRAEEIALKCSCSQCSGAVR